MTFSNVLRIDKKRDYNITSFDKVGKFIAYSDCKDTQVFTFDQDKLQLTKLTQKICLANEGLDLLPAALHLKIFEDPDTKEPKLLILDSSLTLH